MEHHRAEARDVQRDQYSTALTATQATFNLYFGSKLIQGASGFVYPDRLGSIGKFYPYGVQRPSATSNDTEKFTGYFRDAESGNDYAINRYGSPGTGRFITPDRLAGRFSDPGSWNKYAYTRGDPVNRVDQRGTNDQDADCDLGSCFITDTFYVNTAPYQSTNDGFQNACIASVVEADGFQNPTAAADLCGTVPEDDGGSAPSTAAQQPACNTDLPMITTTLQNLESDIVGITEQMDAAITPTDLSALQSTLSADVTQELNSPTSFFQGGHFFLGLSLVSVASDFGGSSTAAYTDFLALFDPAGNGRRYPSPVATTDPNHTYYLHDHSVDGGLDLTFHFDRYNPYHNFPIGTLQHFGVDVLYGSLGVHCLDPAWRN